jgi:NTE family protein
MAVSAAFPGGIGPLAIETNEYVWLKSESWNSTNLPSKIIPAFCKLHIYDGGLYDNLGMESLFDIGKREIKSSGGNIDFLIISDAGAELSKKPLNLISLLRGLRFMGIVMSQARALRVRAFVDFLQKNPSSGMYLQIGSDLIAKIKTYKPDYEIDETQWLSSEKIKKSAAFKTSLKKMAEEDFDMIARHGYETAKWNFIAFFN